MPCPDKIVQKITSILSSAGVTPCCATSAIPGDGNAAWTRALGLELDRSASGMGLRMQRFSMLVEDGVVKRLNIEAPGKFEVSDAETMLQAL